MKTVHYVKKYNLSSTDKFSHKHFAVDFGNDFLSRLEVYKQFSTYSLKRFFDLVDEMRNKFHQIDKKTAGNLPIKLWNYMYYNIMEPMIDVEFPEICALKDKVDISNIAELKMLLLEQAPESYSYKFNFYVKDMAWEWDHQYEDNSIGELGLKPNYDYEKIKDIIYKIDSYILYYIFDELTYQLKKLGASKAKVQFKIHIKEKEKRKKEEFNWFNFLNAQHLRVNVEEYIAYFSMLNIKPEATKDDVNKAYRQMSLVCHPDKGGNQEKFIELTEAKNKCLEFLVIKSTNEF